MSSRVVIEADSLSKDYLIYSRPQDRLRELLWGGNRAFHKRFKAIQRVSFRVNQGTTLGIVGRNGSGKSTLLQMITGTVTPTSGVVRVDGKVGALLELGSGFNPDFTGRENVYIYGSIIGMSREEMTSRIEAIVTFADIGEFVDQPIKTYSSGMQVRLAFAAAIHMDPDILLIDEVLAVGDPGFQLKCYDKIRDFKASGKTIVLVSHDINAVSQFCDSVLVLSHGELVFSGRPDEALDVYKAILFSGGPVRPSEVVQPAPEAPTGGGIEEHPPRLNRHEHRFGSREAEIVDVRILGKGGRTHNVFLSNEETEIVFRVHAHRPVREPIYGIRIRNRQGAQVYVKNSIHRRMTCPSLARGTLQEVRFRQRLPLMANDYFLSVGVSEFQKGEVVALDRRRDVLPFKIVGTDGLGIANLDSLIELTQFEHASG
jgi:ABC-type polysaccharide/polyol phosphate transport system ATPase subunit